MTLDKFLENEGYVGGVYKISTNRLKELIIKWENIKKNGDIN